MFDPQDKDYILYKMTDGFKSNLWAQPRVIVKATGIEMENKGPALSYTEPPSWKFSSGLLSLCTMYKI